MQKVIKQTRIRGSRKNDQYEEAILKIEAELGGKYLNNSDDASQEFLEKVASTEEKYGIKRIIIFHCDPIGRCNIKYGATVHEESGQFNENIITEYEDEDEPFPFREASRIHKEILKGISQQNNYMADEISESVKESLELESLELEGIPDYLSHIYFNIKKTGGYAELESSLRTNKLTEAYEKLVQEVLSKGVQFCEYKYVHPLFSKYGLTTEKTFTKTFFENSNMQTASLKLTHDESEQFVKINFDASNEFVEKIQDFMFKNLKAAND